MKRLACLVPKIVIQKSQRFFPITSAYQEQLLFFRVHVALHVYARPRTNICLSFIHIYIFIHLAIVSVFATTTTVPFTTMLVVLVCLVTLGP